MTDKEQEPERTEVSESYVVAMRRREETFRIPGFPPDEAYITARHPGEAEDEVLAAGLSMTWTAGRQQQAEGVKVQGSVGTARGFIAKCVYQITDFKLPVEELNGQRATRVYDPRNHGDNRENRELYVQMLGSAFCEQIEDFLDYVAGRDTPGAEDFAALKNGQRP